MPPLDAMDASQFFDEVSSRRQVGRKAEKRRQRRQRSQTATSTTTPLTPLNVTQADYIEALETSDQVFAVGPAGTGKTYLAARMGIRQIINGTRDRIHIARPTVARKKHAQGFLPGKLEAKLEPWLIPIMAGFKAEISATTIARLQMEGRIEFLSFEHLRGRSLDNAVVLLDEAQNCDLIDLKLFLTRIGDQTQVIVSGDLEQTDIPDSGLEEVLDMIEDYNIPASVIEFTEDDVVRSETAKHWVRAFARH